MPADQGVAIRIAVLGIQQGKRDLEALGPAGQAALDRVGLAANQNSKRLDEFTQASTKAARQTSQSWQNAGFQIQDVFVQISGGTGIIQSAAQQLPQLLSAFNFGPIGIAAAVAAAAMGVFATKTDLFGTSAEGSAKKVKEQEQSLKDLYEAFNVSTDSADKFTASIARLTREQALLADSRLTDTLKEQETALRNYEAQIGAAANATRRNVREILAARDAQSQGSDPGLGPAVPAQDPQQLQEQREALQNLQATIEAFQRGQSTVAELRSELQGLASVPGIQSLAGNLAAALREPAEQAEPLRQKLELIRAEQTLLVDPTNQAALAVVNQAKAFQDGIAAADAYEKALRKANSAAEEGLSKRELFIRRGLESASIQDLPEGERAGKEQTLRDALDRQFTEKENIALAERRAAIDRELTARERELSGALDERARAGERAAASMRAREGATEGQIAKAKAQALAEYDRGKAIENANKAATTAARQTDFLQRKEQEAEAAKREAAAIRGTAEETERALRVLRVENEYRNAGLNVQDAAIQKRIQESVAVLELTDSLKAEQKAREALAGAQKLQGRYDASLGNAPATDAVTQAAVETANALAKARGDASISFEEVRRLVGVYSQYEKSLEDVSDPKFREEQLALNIALHRQGEAGEQAAKGLDSLSEAKRGLAQEREITAALKEGLAAYTQRKIAIKVDNELREEGVGLSQQEREELRKVKTERETLNESNAESLKRIEESAERMAEVFQQPFKDLTSTISNIASETVLEFEQSGDLSGKAFAERFTAGIQKIGANLVGTIASAPINAAVGSLSAALTEAMKQPGGGGIGAQIGALGKWATANPLNAGLAGAAGGGLIGSVGGAAFGRPGSYAGTGGSIGGAAGAALGLWAGGPVGAAVGGLLGSVGGSFLGGMFGGGDDNSGDNNNFGRWNPVTGFTRKDKVQEGGEQNDQIVRQVVGEVAKLTEVFAAFGGRPLGPDGDPRTKSLEVASGNNSGITVNGTKYASVEAAIAGAIQFSIDNLFDTSKASQIQRTILENTKATSAQGLQTDLDFGKTFLELTGKLGPTGRAIQEVEERFDALQLKAEQLGLSSRKLEEAQDAQIHLIKEEARNRIAVLTGATEYDQALMNLNATYEEAKKAAIDLGMSTKDLNAARDRERDRLQDEAETSIRRLTGDFGSLDEAMLQLNTTYNEAKKLANDLGLSTEKLNAARDHEREKLRAGANADLRVLMGEWDPLAQQILQLRNVFEAANENARDLGYTEERLIEARKRATAELIETRHREAEDAVASQAEQMRGFFSSILDPLHQAQSAFGGLQGIAAPSASIDAGLADFRDVAGRARKDDLSAIQQLPGLGQQLIQYARQYGASGAPANDIIREVQAAYAEIENRYRDRQLEVMQSIPDAVIRTGADQIKAMQAGLDRVVEQLRIVEKTIRANKSGLLTAA